MSGELKTKVGGQAVLEGVMMRSPKCFAVVVRRKDGALVVREQPWRGEWARKLASVPFLRGVATLFESMSNGYHALNFSAEQMEEDLVAEETAKAEQEAKASADAGDAKPYRAEPAPKAKPNDSSASQTASRIATVAAIVLFIAIPQLMAWLGGRLFGPGLGMQDFAFHALTGAFKLALVVGYMLAIRRIPEIRRVFEYHGAEHKAIATFEAGQPLEVQYAKQHSTRHARCGTTFLIVVVIVSVLVYAALLPPLLKGIGAVNAQVFAIAIKVLMLPLIAGFAYELQRLGARFADNPIARVFLGPGYLVQGITTIEPSDDQLEVALASLKVTLAREAAESAGKSAPVTEPVVRKFRSFEQFTEQFAIAGFKG
jgi:uncharacterized protein YqhQ